MRLREKITSIFGKKHTIVFRPETKELCGTGYQHPLPAREYLPDWYRKMPRSIPGRPFLDQHMSEPSLTMKACVPLLDAFSLGYIQELACDIEVAVDEDKSNPWFFWQNSSRGNQCAAEDPET